MLYCCKVFKVVTDYMYDLWTTLTWCPHVTWLFTRPAPNCLYSYSCCNCKPSPSAVRAELRSDVRNLLRFLFDRGEPPARSLQSSAPRRTDRREPRVSEVPKAPAAALQASATSRPSASQASALIKLLELWKCAPAPEVRLRVTGASDHGRGYSCRLVVGGNGG